MQWAAWPLQLWTSNVNGTPNILEVVSLSSVVILWENSIMVRQFPKFRAHPDFPSLSVASIHNIWECLIDLHRKRRYRCICKWFYKIHATILPLFGFAWFESVWERKKGIGFIFFYEQWAILFGSRSFFSVGVVGIQSGTCPILLPYMYTTLTTLFRVRQCRMAR